MTLIKHTCSTTCILPNISKLKKKNQQIKNINCMQKFSKTLNILKIKICYALKKNSNMYIIPLKFVKPIKCLTTHTPPSLPYRMKISTTL